LQSSWWRQLFKVGSLIGLSKATGFFRDLLTGMFLGTSFSSDAFNTAALFTNNLFILFGGLNGPFHSATVSSLTGVPQKKQGLFLGQVLLFSFLFFFVLAFVLYFLIAFSFKEFIFRERASSLLLKETLTQLKLMLPVFFMIGVIGVLFGASCFRKKFVLPGLGHIFSNLSVIFLSLLFFKNFGALIFGIASSVGAVLQVLVIFFNLVKNKIFSLKDLRISLFFNKKIDSKYFSNFKKILLPALFSSTSGSLNVYLDWFFCTDLVQGSWSAILYGNRLIQFPFGVLVGASLVSFLPKISQYKNQKALFRKTLQEELKNLSFLLVPASALFLSLCNPIVYVLFERGEFDSTSTELVSSVLFALALSLLTGLPREIYTRAFYALEDSKAPLYITLGSLILNFIFNILLVKKFAVAGIAFSTTLTALCNSVIFMFVLSFKQKDFKLFIDLKTVFVSIINFLLCFLSSKFIYQFFSKIIFLFEQIPQVSVIVNLLTTGIITFLFYLLLVKIENNLLCMIIKQKRKS